MDVAVANETVPFRELYYSAQDGLKLHARDYGDRHSSLTPVVCLPGLSRNAKDFHDLALELSVERRVLALDYRGRGRSDYAPDPQTYTPFMELLDTLAGMDAAGIAHAVIVGTSRGGIIAMLMGSARPTAIRGVVLNDVGPQIEAEGLLRIAGYLTHSPKPESWSHATTIVKQINEATFTNLTEAEWDAFARRLFRDDNGVPVSDYDPKLAQLLSRNLTASRGHVPQMWPQFKSLSCFPLLAIRGENSDILTKQTLEAMSAAAPAMRTLTVRDRGHAPFLTEPGVLSQIERILNLAD